LLCCHCLDPGSHYVIAHPPSQTRDQLLAITAKRPAIFTGSTSRRRGHSRGSFLRRSLSSVESTFRELSSSMASPKLDLAFAMDCTGSMGAYIVSAMEVTPARMLPWSLPVVQSRRLSSGCCLWVMRGGTGRGAIQGVGMLQML